MPRPTTTLTLTPGAPYVTCCIASRPHRGPAPARTCIECGRLVCALHSARDLSPGQKCICTTCAAEKEG